MFCMALHPPHFSHQTPSWFWTTCCFFCLVHLTSVLWVAGQGDLHSHSAGCESGRSYLQMSEPTGLHSHLTAQQGEGHLAQP